MSEDGVFITCWGNSNYRDDQVVLAASVGDLKTVPVPGRKDGASDWIVSLATGHSAWTTLYADPSDHGTALYLEPNTCLSDLADKMVLNGALNKKISSIKIASSRPDDWPGPSVSSSPGLWRGSILSDLGKASINKSLKKLCVSLTKSIPGAGPFISLLLNIVWPSNAPSRQEVWAGMQKWVASLVNDIGIEVLENNYAAKAEYIRVTLESIEYEIEHGATAELAASYAALISKIQEDLARMDTAGGEADAETLGYITILGTLMLAVLRGGFVYCEDIFGSTVMQARYREITTDAIATLRGVVKRGLEVARTNRMAQLAVAQWHHSVVGDDHFQLRDPYLETYAGYDSSTSLFGNSAVQAANIPKGDQAFYAENYVGPTFDALFGPFQELADLWTWFDQFPMARGELLPEPERRVVKMGAWGGNGMTVTSSLSVSQVNQIGLPFDLPPRQNARITRLELYGVQGIKLFYDDGTSHKVGRTSTDAGDLQVFDLSDPGRTIIGAFGAWDTGLKSIIFRTNYSTGEGGVVRYDNGNHLGGDSGKGGFRYVANGSDGGDAVLSGLFGFTNDNPSDGYPLSGLGFYWTYDRRPIRPDYQES